MKNRRENQRTNLAVYLKVKDENDKDIIGRVGDISNNGIMLLSEVKFLINEFYQIKIVLPKALNYQKNEINMQIRTKWGKPDFNPQYLCTGCEFLNIKNEDQAIINDLIQRLGYGLMAEK